MLLEMFINHLHKLKDKGFLAHGSRGIPIYHNFKGGRLTGYIKIERGPYFHHPSLNKSNRQFCEVTAFIWLLTEASFKDRIFRIYEQEIELKRGQLCCSLDLYG